MARSSAHAKVLKLMQRPTGVTVEEIVQKFDLENEKQARGLVDRVRFKLSHDKKGHYDANRGTKVIKNVASHTFKAHKNLRLSGS
jgi:hypothetical protein